MLDNLFYIYCPTSFIILFGLTLLPKSTSKHTIISIYMQNINYFLAALSIIGAILFSNYIMTTQGAIQSLGIRLVFVTLLIFIPIIFILVKPGTINSSNSDCLFVLYVGVFAVFLILLSTNFFYIFLGIELLTFCQVIIACSKRFSSFSLEAGLKYLLYSAAASSVLILSLVNLYTVYGTLQIDQLLAHVDSPFPFFLLLVFFFFKLGVVPFHAWVPDVYEGSPFYAVLFISTIPKIPIWYLSSLLLPKLSLFFIFFSLASIILGNLASINQVKTKNLIAYSTILNTGYVLFGINSSFFWYFLFAYFLTTILWLSWIDSVRRVLVTKRLGYLMEYNSLGKYHTSLGWHMLVLACSLAGIPPFLGFKIKLILFVNPVIRGLYLLTWLIFLVSLAGAYYYSRLIEFMYFRKTFYSFLWTIVKIPPIGYLRGLIFSLGTLGLLSGIIWSIPSYL